MCSGSHGQTTGSHSKRERYCPRCRNKRLEKVRRAVIEARPQNPEEICWYCLECGWYEAVQ